MTINLILLVLLLISALWTAMTTRLLRSAVGLGITSAVLTLLMFRFKAPLAAVFELSVCSGLISVVFISTISLTQRVDRARLAVRRKERFGKFWYLPILLIIATIFLLGIELPAFNLALKTNISEVRDIIWNVRHLDLFGQMAILLAATLGVAMLFKQK